MVSLTVWGGDLADSLAWNSRRIRSNVVCNIVTKPVTMLLKSGPDVWLLVVWSKQAKAAAP